MAWPARHRSSASSRPTGPVAIWLAYGIGIANVPLIVTDSVGLCWGLVTWITAVRLSRRHFLREAIHDAA